jgi:hypothetical protein
MTINSNLPRGARTPYAAQFGGVGFHSFPGKGAAPSKAVGSGKLSILYDENKGQGVRNHVKIINSIHHLPQDFQI